jgi:hypothetical protein
VDNQRINSGRLYRVGKSKQYLIRILVIDSDTALNCHWNFDGRPQGNHTITNQRWLSHQASTEASLLNAVGWTTHVEVDLVVTEILADTCGLRERLWVTSTQLQGDWMLKRVEPKQPFAISTQHCTGGEHFSVNQRPARQQPVEKPTVPIGPFHHRGDAESMGNRFVRLRGA